jgi:malate dehydrogenase
LLIYITLVRDDLKDIGLDSTPFCIKLINKVALDRIMKVAIIGAGNLGAGIGYEIASRGIVEEIVLIDILKDLAKGQAADINQALAFNNHTKVSSGNYQDLAGTGIIIITAGKPRTAEMTDRLQLAEINLKIISSILNEIKKHVENPIIITITNPMDIINRFIHEAGFSREKVIGSGGQLDSARLKTVLGDVGEVFVLGEHGQNQVPIFSKMDSRKFSAEDKESIQSKVKESALNVIQNKGATIFAPAKHTADMVENIVMDKKRVMACSVNLKGEFGLENVSVGVPVKLGKLGIEEIAEWRLEEDELSQLQQAAEKLKRFYESVTKSHQQKLI